MRGILGEQCRGHGDPTFHRLRHPIRHDGLAAQDAVLVGEGKPHHLKPVGAGQFHDLGGGRHLIGIPQTVPVDKARAS